MPLPLRHKRSQAKDISLPLLTSASTMVFDQDEQPADSRFSGEHLTPNDGYSTLFTSGLNLAAMPSPSPTLSSFPSPPRTSPHKPIPAHLAASSHLSPTTPGRRRRSSIMHTTPSSVSPKKLKAGGIDGGVERALDNVMRSLKLVAMGTPRGRYDYDSPQFAESRWSSSSEGTTRPSIDHDDEESSGFWKPRKSSETTRSKGSRAPSRATIRSAKSSKVKGRKSEDTDRMDLDLDDVVPDVPAIPEPITPGRSKRLIQGLVRRLRLTPKKSSKITSALTLPDYPPPPLPLPMPEERNVLRKSSLSTLRSVLTKKGSTTTLRSVRSIHQGPSHSFASAMGDDTSQPPLPPGLPRPKERDFELWDGHTPSPHTPGKSGRRTPKSSIGQPKLQPETSPSFFLREMPRRAPETPKRTTFDADVDRPTQDPHTPACDKQEGVIRFETEDPAELPIGDMTMADDSMDNTREEIFTPPPARPAFPSSSASTHVKVLALDSPFAPTSQSTPVLAGTPVLTAKAARAQVDGSISAKPRRLLSLLPKHQQKLGSPSPSFSGNAFGCQPTPPLPLRSKKSASNLLTTGGRVNALGLPAPKTEHRPASEIRKLSRRDPLGIMRRFDRGSENDTDMPFRSGAGDGWGTPALPVIEHRSHSRAGVSGITLGSSESYFDYPTDTFGRSSPRPSQDCTSVAAGVGATSQKVRQAVPDFSTPRPSSTEEGMGSPEYSFRLELDPSNRFTDENEGEVSFSSNISVHGLDWQHDRYEHGNRRLSKMSEGSMSISMTTGEGVEEWELERYLKDLESEEGGLSHNMG